MTGMFARLSDLTARHHKKIIVLWLLLLLPALLIAPQVGDVLLYEETAVRPPDLPSTKAQAFIDEHFDSGQGDSSSTIIVIHGADVLDNRTKELVHDIERDIDHKADMGELPDGTALTTLYGVVENYAFQFLTAVRSAYGPTNDSVTASANILFGLPEGYRSLWNETSAAAFVVYGAPYLHVRTWEEQRDANPNWTVQLVDSVAYDATIPALLSSPTFRSLDDQAEGLCLSWFQAYAAGWNATASVSGLAEAPLARYETAISSNFPAFVQALPLSPEEAAFLLNARSHLGLQNWSDFQLLSGLAFEAFQQRLGGLMGNVTEEQRQIVDSYLAIFLEAWNASASIPTDPQYRAMVDSSARALASSIGGTEGGFLLTVHEALGWERWKDAHAIRDLAVSLVSQETRVEPWLVERVGSLPGGASLFDLLMIAKDVVSDHPLADFPMPLVEGLVGSFVNEPDNDTMLLTIGYGEGKKGSAYITTVRSVVSKAAEDVEVDHYVTGRDAISYDVEHSIWGDIGLIEPVSILLVLVLIGLFFRSLVASSIPPMVIGLALGLSFTLVTLLGLYLVDVHYSVLPLLVTSSLGAGCDYCIFIMSRYREERRKGQDKESAIRTSVTWAGESIATSGLTVIIGFGVLALGSYWVIQSIGLALAMGIGIALMAALTLLPSVLMLLGDRMFWPAKLGAVPEDLGPWHRYFVRAAETSIKHAKTILVLAVLISVPTTYLALTLDTSYDFIGAMADTESKDGLSAMQDGFGAGRITPTRVALYMSQPVEAGGDLNLEMLDSIRGLTAVLSGMDNVQSVTGPTQPLGEPIEYRNLSSLPALQRESLSILMLSMLGSNDSRAVLINVVFKEAPYSEPTIGSIEALRQVVATFDAQDPGVNGIYVGGSTAQVSDTSDLMSSEFMTMEVLVIAGIYVVLMAVLRSVVSPLRSILTILLSISWTLAATMLIFEHLRGVPILWLLPMVLMVVCLGLGMDYDIFITTRIREEVERGKGTKDAIVEAMRSTGGVITACGIIMAGAFGTLVVSSGALLQEFGFALAFAILLDATVVRIYLVPAIISLLGDWNWYAPWRPLPRRRDEGGGKGR